MTVNEFLAKHPTTKVNGVRDCVVCNDGLVLSVQASTGHYCTPKENNAAYYTHVEFQPQTKCRMPWTLRKYYKSWVYAFVPVEKVDALIRKHGGIKDSV